MRYAYQNLKMRQIVYLTHDILKKEMFLNLFFPDTQKTTEAMQSKKKIVH